MEIGRLRSLLAPGASGIDALHTVEDMRAAARRKLPRMIFDFVDGGADGELAVSANRAALDAIRFAPSYLTDVTDRDQGTKIFGTEIASPFILSPSGLATLAHPDGIIADALDAVLHGKL